MKDLNFKWNYTLLEFKPRAVEKNESIIGSLAGIEPMLLQCWCNAQWQCPFEQTDTKLYAYGQNLAILLIGVNQVANTMEIEQAGVD